MQGRSELAKRHVVATYGSIVQQEHRVMKTWPLNCPSILVAVSHSSKTEPEP
jgi:hypothetical protein